MKFYYPILVKLTQSPETIFHPNRDIPFSYVFVCILKVPIFCLTPIPFLLYICMCCVYKVVMLYIKFFVNSYLYFCGLLYYIDSICSPPIAGRYNFKIIQRLAEGGFATIYKAENDKKPLIIKVCPIY